MIKYLILLISISTTLSAQVMLPTYQGIQYPDYQPPIPSGSVFCQSANNVATYVLDVTSTTGKIWMDRNLGATRAATSSTDANAYGDLYQWGRFTDGHQCRTSSTTSTLSSTDVPENAFFILNTNDWRSTQNANLWQGVNGTNNPCPSGYRLPTSVEWGAERSSWSPNNAGGAFNSPLKLPMAGYRNNTSGGNITNSGSDGYYWSSTVSTSQSIDIWIGGATALPNHNRSMGFTVRCIKN
jgi:uncharacterized protein (TIGR02145 family)